MKVKKLVAVLTATMLALSASFYSCTVTYDEDFSAHRSVVSNQAETIAHTPDEAEPAFNIEPQSNDQSVEPKEHTDDITQETEPADTPEIAPDADKASPGFIVVPRFYNLSVSETIDYLASYGITAYPESDAVSPDAQVVVLSFYGMVDDESFYILPGYDVTLKVGGVPEESKPDNNTPQANGKVAYLTFDDGPTRENTQKIIDILESFGAKATFFVVGTAVRRFPGRTRLILESGNAIGCHSYSHEYDTIYTSKDGFLSDMQSWYDAVCSDIGEDYACSIYRMPGGSANAKKYSGYTDIKAELEAREYKVFDWTMSNNDVWSRSKAGDLSPVEYEKKCFAEQLEQLDRLGRPIIILMHETYDSTVEMLPWAIELLQSKGYSFDTLDRFTGEYVQH